MRFTIPYTYEEEYLPTKRHRKPRTRREEAAANIEVIDVAEKSFPVAFIVHEYGHVYAGAKTYQEILDKRADEAAEFCIYDEVLRVFNGKLYRPRRVSYGAAISTCFEPAERMVDYLKGDWYRVLPETNPRDPGEIHLSDNRDKLEKAMQAKADNFVIFNDEIWMECGEPMYVVYTFGLGHNHGGTALSIDYYYNDNLGKERYFTALQRKEAIAYGKKVAETRGDTKSIDSIIGCKQYIDVLIPEMVRRNPAVEHGDGNEFTNLMESFIEISDSVGEAGLLVTAMAMANS